MSCLEMGEQRQLIPNVENSFRRCTARCSVDDEALAKIE